MMPVTATSSTARSLALLSASARSFCRSSVTSWMMPNRRSALVALVAAAGELLADVAFGPVGADDAVFAGAVRSVGGVAVVQARPVFGVDRCPPAFQRRQEPGSHPQMS